MSFSMYFYRRVICSFTTLLLLTVGPAYAEWVKFVSFTDQGSYSVYVDLDTIRRKGELVKMWVLFDFDTQRVTLPRRVYLSMQSLEQFDCAEERSRMLAFTNFAGNMGTGDVVYSNTVEGKWQPLPPESIGKGLWELAWNME